MRRANQVIDLPILTATDSRQVGTVKDVAYAPSRDRVVGFLVDGPDRDALPFGSISEITADTVFVASDNVFVDTDDAPEIREAVDSDVTLNGLSVVDVYGDEVGTIEDTFFDERSGLIAGFQISRSGGGMFGGGDDRTKFYLPIDHLTDWSSDHVRVPMDQDADDLYRERYPSGYDEYGEYRRAA